jgi:S1-C subfamily serine protease
MIGAYRGPRGEIILGDIITEVAGQPVRGNDDFYDAMEKLSPGDSVTVTTLRGEETRHYEVEVIESQ